jgi:hypothetical protein
LEQSFRLLIQRNFPSSLQVLTFFLFFTSRSAGYHPRTPVKNKKKSCGLSVQMGLKSKKISNVKEEIACEKGSLRNAKKLNEILFFLYISLKSNS